MPIKDINRRREYRRNWYSKNKASEKKHVSRRKKEIGEWFNKYRETLSCSACGENHPATLDFHHKDKSSKDFAINILVHNGYSLSRIKKEMEKCQVVCANCHRKIHHHLKT